jgi:hypothetical protein
MAYGSSARDLGRSIDELGMDIKEINGCIV